MDTLTAPVSDEILVRHLDDMADRYACYPGTAHFDPGFTDVEFGNAIRSSNGDLIPHRLSLHVAVPQAFQACFCGDCRPLASRDRSRSGAYLDRLVREIALVGGLCDRDRDVAQLTLAPGALTLFDAAQLGELLESMSRNFHVPRGGKRDFAVTLDPHGTRPPGLRALVDLGFNRASFALQEAGSWEGGGEGDAPCTDLLGLVEACRAAGLGCVRVDLLFGPPRQGLADVEALISQTVETRPDRIAIRDCAHLPESFHLGNQPCPQRSEPAERASMLAAAYRALIAAGYLHVGMDLFALPHDPLVGASRSGQLYRDALGFGTHGETDLLGFGVGAISQIGGAYCQSSPRLRRWEAAIDAGRCAVQHGLFLTEDDLARADIVQALTCHGRLDTRLIEHRHSLDFGVYFAPDLVRLDPLLRDGLAAWEGSSLVLSSSGRLLSRIVAACFDRYLHQPAMTVQLRAQP